MAGSLSTDRCRLLRSAEKLRYVSYLLAKLLLSCTMAHLRTGEAWYPPSQVQLHIQH